MKKIFQILSYLMVLSLFLTACGTPATNTATPETPPIQVTAVQATEEPMTATEDILYVNLVWHQHQPLYYKDEDGVYTRPWVRVHATKDYYDMASTIEQYPDIHATINLTPVLISQLDDFTNNGAKDLYWVISEIPADQLTDEQKQFILERFFDANWDNMIGRFPRYQELLNKRGGTDADAVSAAMKSFSVQDFRDLQIWFNLAWFDPQFLAEEPLKGLVEKGKNFAEADKGILFGQVEKVMSEVIPLHKTMQDLGQIEVITTPYAHPILPLIYNTDIATVGNPAADMPNRFSWPNDAIAHLEKSVEVYQDHFGKSPTGLWPGEGSVSEDIVPLVANAGYQWMATGEPVLAASLGIGDFTRDANDTVQQADDLYRPYSVTGSNGKQVAVFFRDWTISDKLGFEYSNMSGEAAADDLIQRLENIRTRLTEENAEGPHIVSIILDGENAWENYPNDGKDFLNSMYQKLSESKDIKTITPDEYLKKFPEQRTLEYLFPGAWFSANYDTWIGETEEKIAWNYLGEVRDYLAKYDVTKKREASPEAIATAQNYMYLAEGSDWFWWYGSDQDSGQDKYFDQGFRALLAKVYESLGDPVPDFVNVPIIPDFPVSADQAFQELSTPVIDGTLAADEWSKGGLYTLTSSDFTGELGYTLDKQNLYVYLSAPSDLAASGASVGFYFSTPKATLTYPFALPASTEATEKTLLGIQAGYLFEWAGGNTISAYQATEDGWGEGTALGQAMVKGSVLEVAIPLNALGDVETGDDLRMKVGLSPEQITLPQAGPAQIIFPDLGLSEVLFEVEDPANDDFGPGTYTYPTDAVFSAQVFDIEKFSVLSDDKNLIFVFKFFGDIPNPWGSTLNLSLQTLDVYIDKDPGAGTGARLLLPGRNAALTAGNGWDFAVWAEGWYPALVAPDVETAEPKSLNIEYKIIADAAKQTVTLRVPKEALGEGDPATWGYAAVVLSQDGYPSAGVWRVRNIQAVTAQWQFGGAPEDVNHTRIIDLVWAADATPTQQEMLSTYPSSNASLNDLTPDDFAQIELMLVK